MNTLLRNCGIWIASLMMTSSYLNGAEVLQLDIVDFRDFSKKSPEALSSLKKGLLEKGIVGIRSVPGYQEMALKFIQSAREFSNLPENIKQIYAPNREAGEFIGYELGHEKFLRADGKWVPDDLKASYYAFVPESQSNKWPKECDLQTPYEMMGRLMFETGKSLLKDLEIVSEDSLITESGLFGVGRMLHYHKHSDDNLENNLWCGAHFDHGLFTVLMPAFYFVHGQEVQEPEEAGLYVRPPNQEHFFKVILNDPDIMLFQMGEFGQLVSNDQMKATEHYVHKATGEIERYTMALFMNPAMEATIFSQSELTHDARYGGTAGDPCTYGEWHTASLQRYHHK